MLTETATKTLPQIRALELVALGYAATDDKSTDDELLRSIDYDYCQALQSSLRLYSDAVGCVSFVNHAMDSANLGRSVLVPFGPGNTMTELPAHHARCPLALNFGTPWAYLATAWAPRDELLLVIQQRLALPAK